MPLLATVVGAAIMGAMLSRGCTRELTPVKGRVDMVEAKADPELAAAVLRARRELPRFIETLANPKPDQRNFAVNARFETRVGDEQIWVTVKSYKDGVFEGTLSAQPYAIPNKRKGDAVLVPEASVSDWTFINGTQIAGDYTMQVLLKREAEKAGK
jgi:uncharacterized protein YegJ (DUF2314 family)